MSGTEQPLNINFHHRDTPITPLSVRVALILEEELSRDETTTAGYIGAPWNNPNRVVIYDVGKCIASILFRMGDELMLGGQMESAIRRTRRAPAGPST